MASSVSKVVFWLVTIMPCASRIINHRLERIVAGVAHNGDAIGLGGCGFGKLGHHFLRVPVGPNVFHICAQVGRSRYRAVINNRIKGAAGRSTGEEHNLGVAAPALFGLLRGFFFGFSFFGGFLLLFSLGAASSAGASVGGACFSRSRFFLRLFGAGVAGVPAQAAQLDPKPIPNPKININLRTFIFSPSLKKPALLNRFCQLLYLNYLILRCTLQPGRITSPPVHNKRSTHFNC